MNWIAIKCYVSNCLAHRRGYFLLRIVHNKYGSGGYYLRHIVTTKRVALKING